MPANKDFKRLVRGRMQKTGESYTAARATLLKQKPSRVAARPVAIDYAALAGRSDAILKEKTGCTWEKWVGALDYVKADAWKHPEIVKYLMEKHRIPGWWAQMVTVGYERIKGLRAVHQRMDGSFEANKSKTFPVPISRVYRAFHDGRTRARWLPDVKLTIRTATKDRYLRLGLPDQSWVVIGFERKGPEKSLVSIQHGKLPDRAAVDRTKAFWGERLEDLKQLLASN
jgi:hypothetical protein